MFDVPVAVIAFRRADHLKRLWDVLGRVKPARLYVITDGPRPHVPGESELCGRVDEFLKTAPAWPCEVRRDRSERNLGCAKRVSSGISWVFGQEERAIILEEDCVPDPSFFEYCRELLDRYRDDPRVMCVTGQSFEPRRKGAGAEADYYFSRYPLCWGWATWRRAWRLYDHGMSAWPTALGDGRMREWLGGNGAVRYWSKRFAGTREGRIDSWAYRWILSCWAAGGVTATPWKNLVHNIGFDQEATHTSRNYRFMTYPARSVPAALTHPDRVERDREADDEVERRIYSKSLWRKARMVPIVLRGWADSLARKAAGHGR
jgi:hypothetical protein